MALINAFGALALDQSVMATTPLLKNINTTLQATPYVYVVNPGTTNVSGAISVSNFPAIQNVKILDAATPLFVDNPLGQTLDVRTLVSTPVTVYQGARFDVSISSTPIVYAQLIGGSTGGGGSTTVTNFPTTQNVTIQQVATPLAVSVVNSVATPIVQLANTHVSIENWPASQNVNITQASTPLYVYQTNWVATPIVYAQIVNQQGAGTSVSVSNFPATQNVKIIDAATPILVYQTNTAPIVASISSTPVTYSAITSLVNTFVTNFPASQNVNVANVATPPAVQNVNVVNAATPLLVDNPIGNYLNVEPAVPLNASIDGTGAAQPFQFAYFNVSTAQTGTSLIASPGAGRSIRVISYAVVVGAAINFSFIGPSTTLLFPLAANGGVSFAGSLLGPAFQVAANTALTYTTSAAGQASGHICYVVV